MEEQSQPKMVKHHPYFQKQKSNKATQSARTCSFCRLPIRRGFSSLNYLKNLGSKTLGALRMMSPRRRDSPKVTSSERAKPCVAPPDLDSQRAQAINDCIEFINTSSSFSSFSRSKSVSQEKF